MTAPEESDAQTARFRVRLEFRAHGPAITGDWEEREPAERTFRAWVGLYGTDRADGPTIRLTERTDTGLRTCKSWPPDREDHPAEAPD